MDYVTDNEPERQQVMRIIDSTTAYRVKIEPVSTMTGKQRSALHVWCRQCTALLNEHGIPRKRHHLFGEGYVEEDWTEEAFKEDVYKYILKIRTGKLSTERQSTIHPSEIAMIISKAYAENGLICPPWPSNR